METAEVSGAPDTGDVGGEVETRHQTGGPPDVDMSSAPRDAQEGDDANPEGGGETYTVRVDGEDLEVTLDELKKGFGRMSSATRRYQEAAEAKREAESAKREIQGFVQRLKSGDRQTVVGLLERIGVDVTKFAQEHLSEYLADLDRPEHERGMRQLEREREAWRREQEEAQSRATEAQIEREAQQHRQRYEQETRSALEKHGLPANPAVMSRVAGALAQALERGYELSVEDAVEMVAEETQSLLRKLDPSAAERLLGGPAAVAQVQRTQAQKAAASMRSRAAQVAKGPKAPPRERVIVDPSDPNALKAFFDGG